MKPHDASDRPVADWLHEVSAHRVPAHLDTVLRETSKRRQRPAWSFPERWLPVHTTLRLAPAPSLAWVLVAVAMIVALAAAIAVVGSRPRLPDPFGPARNGSIVFAAVDGDIHALDPVTGVSRVIVAGPETDRAPLLSPDGSRLLFDRDVAAAHVLMVAGADGSNPRVLAGPIPNVDGIEWSPDGSHVVMDSDAGGVVAIRVVGLDGSTATVLTHLAGSSVAAIEGLHWRPSGRELIFQGWSNELPSYGLYAIRSDGTGLRPILPTTTSSDRAFGGPSLSPDGRSIAYTIGSDGGPIHIVDVDTGLDRLLSVGGPVGGDLSPFWSPDGTRIGFLRHFESSVQLMVAPVTGGTAVATGPAIADSGSLQAQFSPDGTKLVAWSSADSSTWIFDPAGGPGQRLQGDATSQGSWQRLAP